ncbi:15786_t:CDS:1, partial [Acaulospora colombiana]
MWAATLENHRSDRWSMPSSLLKIFMVTLWWKSTRELVSDSGDGR